MVDSRCCRSFLDAVCRTLAAAVGADVVSYKLLRDMALEAQRIFVAKARHVTMEQGTPYVDDLTNSNVVTSHMMPLTNDLYLEMQWARNPPHVNPRKFLVCACKVNQ